MGVLATTEYGTLEGVFESGAFIFRNVPFAAAPFGDLRFRPPVPPAKWDGVRDASLSGPGAPQPSMDAVDEVDAKYFNPRSIGEDCLTLEITTPDPNATGLPVMVWIHGGGYMLGVGSAPGYSGAAFARDGVVHVAINYRLGFDGFVYLGEGTDNLGLRDQVAGLEWVQRNIASFGGDPANVTIFGQSGGGVSVMNLLAMPSARGLFARAIAMSGSPVATVDTAEAGRFTRRAAKKLRIPPTLAGYRSTTPDQTVAQTLALAFDFVNPLKSGSKAFMISPYRGVHGTPTMPDAPLVVAAAGPSVPLMTGTNRNETIGFLKLLGRLDHINPFVAWLFKRLMNANGEIRKAYRTGPRRITNPLALVEAVWTDWGFRIPTLQLVEARLKAAPSVPTYVYEFRWESPSLPAGLGAFHALEAPFVRDDLATLQSLEGSAQWVGPNAPQELAHRVHGAWVSFAKTGNPGWAEYDLRDRTTMVFNSTSEVVADAAAPERQAWTGHR
jgi:para-nitrobenzyl esterase